MKKGLILVSLGLSLMAGVVLADIPSEPTQAPSPTPTPEPAGGCDMVGCVQGVNETDARGMSALLLGMGLVGGSILLRRRPH